VTRTEYVPQPPASRAARLRELAGLFLKLGATAFGGPAVHIALLQNEVVDRRRWLTRDEFLDLLGATNLIPGPNSTEMAMHVGQRRAGLPGLLVAGACFILPAFLIVAACAWLYLRYAQTPAIAGVLYGVKPVVIAIVLQALWRLGRTALRSRSAAIFAVAALAAVLLGAHELLVLLAAGVLLPILRGVVRSAAPGSAASIAPLLPLGMLGASASAVGAAGVSLGGLFAFFLKVGAVLYGSGYVLLAFLRADLVERWGWLSETQLLDAVAIGQVTPGPLFTTATFIGYVLAGPAGACVATVGIFLPGFVFVACTAPLIARLRTSPVAAAFLDGVNAASLALMAAVTLELLGSAFVDAVTVALGVASAVALLLTRLNPIWLVLAGAVAGFLAR